MCRSSRSPGHHRKRKIFSQIKRLSYGRKRTTTENVKPYTYIKLSIFLYTFKFFWKFCSAWYILLIERSTEWLRNRKWSWNTQSNNIEGGTWFTHGEGSMGVGGGLPIARDWKWEGWRESCLSIKESLFFRKTCGFTVPVNWLIIITSTIYSLEIPIPSDCGLRACWEFFGTQSI